jgi:phage I-like protein
MVDQDYATVNGARVDREDFAYAPVGSEPSEWKLPIHDESHVRNALARFNQTCIPAKARAAVRRKILQRARKYGIDASGFEKERGSENRKPSNPQLPIADCRLTILLTNEGMAVETPAGMVMHRPGAQLREIAVAVPGRWVKDDSSFSITDQDLTDMVRNFGKRKNDMIVIDYEHASEQPGVAKGGPIPGAGWIHGLHLGAVVGAHGHAPLQAMVEWTPQAEEMLRSGQYRFFSPAIDWGARDKQTGERQGATLTSGALTNHPFLEELPPIMLSDGTLVGTRDQGIGNTASQGERFSSPWVSEGRRQKSEIRNQKGAKEMGNENKELLTDPEERLAEKKDDDSDDETLPDDEPGGEKHGLPMLTIRKGQAGTKHEGHHVLRDGDEDVGCVSDGDFAAHARKHLALFSNANREEASEVSNRLILSDVAKDGRLNNRRASELAGEQRITLADYIRAREAEKLIEGAVQTGKILPKDRQFFFRDALERPAEFAEYVKGAPQALKLGVYGLGEADSMTPDQEVAARTQRLISENDDLSYPQALKRTLSEDPGLAERYRSAHCGRVNADGTAN